MNVNEVEIKLDELKVNLTNQRTANELKGNGYDVDNLIRVINIYLKNLQTITNNELLQAIRDKVINLLSYTNQPSISGYIHSFENEANFLILKASEYEQNEDIENESNKNINIEDLENKYNQLNSTIANLTNRLDSSILNLTNQFGQVNESLSNCAQNFNFHDEVLKKLQEENIKLEDKKKIYDSEIEKLKELQKEYENAKNAALNDVKLKKSLKYWDIKQKQHNKKFWIFIVIAISLICVLIGSLYGGIYIHKKNQEIEITNKVENKLQNNDISKNQENSQQNEKKDESFIKDLENGNLPWYLLMIFATSSIFWIIRITVKIALSNLHLSEDAHERVVMIYTYLSFVQKGQLDDEKEDKKLILSSLFRPSNIGIIQDESSVTITDIITAFKK